MNQAKNKQEAGNAEHVLDGRIGRERHGVLFGLRLDAGRIVLARDMQRPDVQHHHAGDQERQEIVQREEAVQRRISDGIAAPQQGHDALAEIGNGGEQVGDDGGAPEAHLAPRQHVTHEARRHHQEVDDDAENPEDFARFLVRPVVQAAEHVNVDGQEEHRCAGGVHVAQQPAVIHVADDAFDRPEGHRGLRRVMHRQDDAGQDLHREHHRKDGAEGPPVVQVARRRIGHERGVHKTHNRQTPFNPLQGWIGRLVVGWSAHAAIPREIRRRDGLKVRDVDPRLQPIWILLSETN